MKNILLGVSMQTKKIFCTMFPLIGIILIVGFVLASTACTGGSAGHSALIGRWQNARIGDSDEYEFFKNGKGVWRPGGDDKDFTWSTANGRLTLKFDGDDESSVRDYSVEGHSLIMQWPNGGHATYRKLGE